MGFILVGKGFRKGFRILGLDERKGRRVVEQDFQCSPYQAVTGKIYRLKQHFLLPATA